MLSTRLRKPWRELFAAELAGESTSTGVYQVADSDGTVIDIGYAGAGSQFGLREALEARLAVSNTALRYRVEINHNYLSRFRELLMVHRFDHGDLPVEVARRGIEVHGQLNPS